jgi:hypothetical protein
MQSRRVVAFGVLIFAISAQFANAGWNYGSRSSCRIFAKYRVEVHAGFTSSAGGEGDLRRDTGCTYAHAGPVRSYTANHLLAEVEGYIGNSAFWGYAHAWNYNDPISGLLKKGVAGLQTERTGNSVVADTRQACPYESARSHFYCSDVVFGGASTGAARTITIKGVTAHLAASSGYSVLEVVVWKPVDDLAHRIPDTAIIPSKVIWRGKAVVHDGRITCQGELSSKLFTASAVSAKAPEAIYSVDNKDIVMPLPTDLNIDAVAVNIRGDAGDESVIDWPKSDSPPRPELSHQQ